MRDPLQERISRYRTTPEWDTVTWVHVGKHTDAHKKGRRPRLVESPKLSREYSARKKAFDLIYSAVRLDTPIHEGERSMKELIHLVVQAMAMKPAKTRISKPRAGQIHFWKLCMEHGIQVNAYSDADELKSELEVKASKSFSSRSIKRWIAKKYGKPQKKKSQLSP